MKILILGGGYQQLPAIRKAKELGLETVVADYLEHPPGRETADRFYRISTRDKDAILALARKENVDGILSYASDPAAPTAAYVAEQLGLPGGYTEAAEILGHKGKFRSFLACHRIPVPEYTYLMRKRDDAQGTEPAQESEDAQKAESVLKWERILIKPADSSGSKGVTVLRNPDRIRILEAYQKAISYAFRGDVLAEEFIPCGYGNLIGGDVVIRDGAIVCLGLMDCVREKEHPLVPCGKIWPCGADAAIRNRIAEIVTQMAHELHITDAEMNVEFIVREDGTVYPIEIALRCGGNGIPQLLSDATGVDWIREEVRRILRVKQLLPNSEYNNTKPEYIYATYNLHANAKGLYAGYELAEELSTHLYREELFCKYGDEVKPYTDASGIIGILYFRFDSREEAERYLYNMQQYLRIHVITIEKLSNAFDTTAFQITSMLTEVSPVTSENIHDEILRLGEHMTPPFSQRDKNGWSSRDYADKLTKNAEIFTARHSNGETVGIIAAYMNRQESAYISMLVVSPLYRRHQIAKALCQNVHELAYQRGIRCIRGEIRRENTACRTMAVEQLGYTVSEITESDIVKIERIL